MLYKIASLDITFANYLFSIEMNFIDNRRTTLNSSDIVFVQETWRLNLEKGTEEIYLVSGYRAIDRARTLDAAVSRFIEL